MRTGTCLSQRPLHVSPGELITCAPYMYRSLASIRSTFNGGSSTENKVAAEQRESEGFGCTSTGDAVCSEVREPYQQRHHRIGQRTQEEENG